MGETIQELFVSIGISGDAAEKMEHLHEQVSELGEKFKEFGEVVIASLGVEKVYEFVEAQAQLGAQVLHLSERLGIESDELQKLGYAAEQSGGSMEGMGAALKFLSRNMAQAAKGGELGQTFKKAGIEVKNADGSLRSATDVMGDLADSIQALPPGAERTALAMRLMGRQGASMIPILSKGRKGLEDMGKEAQDLGGIMSEEYLEAAHHAEQQSNKLNFAWKGLKQTIAMELFPSFSDMTEGLSKHVAELSSLVKNTTFVRTALIGVAGIASLKVVPAFLSLAKSVAGVSKEAGLMETALGLGEFLAIAAGVAIILLAFDDLWGMFEGKDSFIGAIIDKFFGFGESAKLVDDVNAAVADLDSSLQGLGITLPGVGGIIEDVFKYIAFEMDSALRGITAIIQALALMSRVGQRAFVALRTMLSGGVDKTADTDIGNLLSTGVGDIGKTLTRASPAASEYHTDTDPKILKARADRERAAYKSATTKTPVSIVVNQHNVKDPRAEAADGVRTALDEKEYDDSFSALGQPEADE